MKSSVVKFAVISFALFLAGCVRFVRIPDEALVLGQTTQEHIKARLGSPYREGVVIKNDQQLKMAAYWHTSVGGEADADGVIAARCQGFYFFNDKLVGYEFTSSWKEDSTNFDSGKISQIKKGESTLSDVVRSLGNPGGKYIYPVIPNRDEEAINYIYYQTKGFFNLKSYQKLLVVTVNKHGIVTNVEYWESGQK